MCEQKGSRIFARPLQKGMDEIPSPFHASFSPPRFAFFFLSTVFSIFLRASPIASTTMGPKHVRPLQEQEAD
jgi:hypothetical protein